MQEPERAFVYNTKYKLAEEEEFLAQIGEAPFEQVKTNIEEDTFFESCALYRKKRTVPAVILTVIGAVIIICAVYGSTRWENENDAYFLMIAAAVPLGFAVLLGIKSYFKSAAFYRYLNRKYEFRFSRICEIAFYSECLTYHDRLNTWPFMKKGIEIYPYTAFVRILRTDDCTALADKDDKSIIIMQKDMPDGLFEWLKEKCIRAKLLDKTTDRYGDIGQM